ncbi:hypothetical protein BJX63DRAFT_417584 [Aspergillus granulosus]|uniref:Glycosyl transferase CAP10 domain-containing protein n=1 Tax=Aspergillus granulosus TaxID=176169 RepID=A0ABR4I433_9EURO
MRSQRLLGLLLTGFLICVSLIFLRNSHSTINIQDTPHVSPLDSSTPQYSLQRPIKPTSEPTGRYPDDVHPIVALIEDAQQQFDSLRERQSRTLADAVREYRRRYRMHPPPHFDKWFKFAQSKGVELIDEYDTIYHTLLPFWALTPQTIRSRTREALGYDNALLGILIRDGKVSLADGLDEEQEWQREATLGMIKNFVRYLPDMDLAFNAHDEPRVILPSEDLQRLVAIAKDSIIPSAFQTRSPVNAWSPRSNDLNRGDRIDEVRTTRFNKISHQPAWTSSRMSCPVDSPVRALDEDTPDHTTAYALGELGFIHNTTAFSDVCNAPSLRNTYGFFDRPNVFAVVHDLFPVFSQSKVSTFQDILYPSPWYWAKKVPYVKEKDYSWEEKINKIYWRGSTTGGFSKGGGWRRHHRQLMVGNINALNTAKILIKADAGQWKSEEVDRHDYHGLFDVQFTSVGQCDRNDCAAQSEFFNITEPVEQQEAWAYKYLVDIDGNAFSGRYHAFLQSNSLVCKVALFREWHDERLKPWVHYVPLSLKGDEVVETMRFFTSEDEARNRLWDLSKKWRKYSHQFYTLRSGFKFHYVCNSPDAVTSANRPLVIFIHGFPDSWAIWRFMLSSESLQESATVVAVDLPGYGGSQSLDRYSATTVLENLTEFIIAMRTKYGIDGDTKTHQQRTIIVAHDWGCVLSLRLATDAPQLADRFIVTNGPLMPLVVANIGRRLSTSLKMFKSFLRSPIQSRALLVNAAKTFYPILRQMKASGYIFIFQLPQLLVEYLGYGGNTSFLKLIHVMSWGKQEFTPYDAAECMASSIGPSIHEGETRTTDGEGYAESTVKRAGLVNFFDMCRYYRDGTSLSRWKKSIETVASLNSIAQETGIRSTSSGAGVFDDGPEGALKARTTIIWGRKDTALTPQLCLDGISDYLGQDSQVIDLPHSAHFTPLERESRVALSAVVDWAVKGEQEDIRTVIEVCYPEATTVYDVLIPVYRTTNQTPANLWLMDRPDLIATFTKIELWRQTQFKRIVYIDCDVVAIRAPDELLDLDVDIAAAPDVGWPDCFNSGVMVLRPNMQDYYALKALAERGISFDGADQGLLNMHFRNWHRLSFTYNCTPSANYQYVPAYKHFQSTISLIHFIGPQKPWNMSRQVTPYDSPYNQLLGRWWTIYDRHYRPMPDEQIYPSSQPFEIPQRPTSGPAPEVSHTKIFAEPAQPQHAEQIPFVSVSDYDRPHPQAEIPSYTHGTIPPQPVQAVHHQEQYQEYHEQREQRTRHEHDQEHRDKDHYHDQDQEHQDQEHHDKDHHNEHYQEHQEHHHEHLTHVPTISAVPQYVRGEEHVRTYIRPQQYQQPAPQFTQPPQHFVQPPSMQGPSVPSEPVHHPDPVHLHALHQQEPMVEPHHEPTPQPPPDVQTSFEAPKAEWDASREPPPLHSKPEGIALETKTYTMSEDHQLFKPPESYPEAPKNMYYQVPPTKPQPEKLAQLFPWETKAPKPTRVFADDERHVRYTFSPESPKEESKTSQSSLQASWTSDATSLPSESWDTYSRFNAWDEVPEIQQYIQTIQQARKAKVQVLSGHPNQQKSPPIQDPSGGSSGIRVTDFPSEIERPSLPVTPAPIRRPPALGSPDEYTSDQLPAAKGVPNQEDWVGLTVDNPSVRLEELRRRQSGVLDNPESLVERLTKALEEGS